VTVNVLHNTHVNLKYNIINNFVLINKFMCLVIMRPLTIVKIWNIYIYIYTHMCVNVI